MLICAAWRLIMTPKRPAILPAISSYVRTRWSAPWDAHAARNIGLVLVLGWLADAQQQAGARHVRRRRQCRARKSRRVDHRFIWRPSPARRCSRIAGILAALRSGSASGMLTV